MTRCSKLGLLALIGAAAMIWLLPSASMGGQQDLRDVDAALKGATQRLGSGVDQAVAPTREKLKATKVKTKAALDKSKAGAKSAGTRQTATDPQTQPPLHGTNPHGQGTVAVVDVDPRTQRPLAGDPDGSESGEDVVVGRARAEERAPGTFGSHVTILALFGNELAGVDAGPGQTQRGPLEPIQQGILDPLCASTQQQVCLSVLTANAAATDSSAAADFAVARAKVGGLGVGAAESSSGIDEDANCQTAVGAARTANVVTSGGPVAQVANAGVLSKSCRGQAPVVTSEGTVIGLGGTAIPLPAPGCAQGTPDTVTGIPGVLTIVCNALEIQNAAIVREALDVFVLSAGTNTLAKETTAAAEAVTEAPEGGTQCTDGVDNDGDGLIDAADPGCHVDNDINKPFQPSDNSEADGGAGTGGSGERAGEPECSDDRDNDGDGLIDAQDPGCHTDGNPNNPDSYDPSDDSEADDRGEGGAGGGGAGDDGAGGLGGDELPFTGANIVALMLAGLLMLAGGLLLRRREDARRA